MGSAQSDASQLAQAASQVGSNPIGDFNAVISFANIIATIAPTRGFSVSLSQSFQEWYPFQQQLQAFWSGNPNGGPPGSGAQMTVFLAYMAWQGSFNYYQGTSAQNKAYINKYPDLFKYFNQVIMPKYDQGFRQWTNGVTGAQPSGLNDTQLSQVKAIAGNNVPSGADWVVSWEALVKAYINACLQFVYGSSSPSVVLQPGSGPATQMSNYVGGISSPNTASGLNGALIPAVAAGYLVTS